MGRLRGRLRKLKREMETTRVVVEHDAGTTSRFRGEIICPDAFLHKFDRAKRHHKGESPYRTQSRRSTQAAQRFYGSFATAS